MPTTPTATVPRRSSALPRWRSAAGLGFAVVGLVGTTVVLSRLRNSVALPTILFLYLLVVVAAAALGGRLPALLSAVAAPLIANWYHIPPIHTWHVGDRQNVIDLIVFVTVAGTVSGYVSVAARRAAEAEQSRREAETLAGLAAQFGDPDPIAALTAYLRSSFDLEAVAVLHRGDDRVWQVVSGAGAVLNDPDDASLVETLDKSTVLALRGRSLSTDDRRVLHAFAGQLLAGIEHTRLRHAAAQADALAQTNSLRTALLQAVSHDLRTPLAGIKASVSSLRQPDIAWSSEATADFLESIEDETDRLTSLVTNLLDVSRLQVGEIKPQLRSVFLEEVVPAALHSLGDRSHAVDLDLSEALSPVLADPALLERVVANLVANAITWSPRGSRVRVVAHTSASCGFVEVVDHGPGIAAQDREVVRLPFHRRGDARAGNGVGLGLAIADGFASAMGGELILRETPRGGLTAVVRLVTPDA